MDINARFYSLSTAEQLGQLLKTSRKRCRFTQAYTASRIGLSRNRVSYLERHPAEISFKQLPGWCAAIGLELRRGERGTPEAARSAEW